MGITTPTPEADAGKQKSTSGVFDKLAGGLTTLGRKVGGVVNVFYQAGRDTIETVIKSVLPFIAFIAFLIGFINATGLGNLIANTLSPLASSLPGLLLISAIVCLPFLSPVLDPAPSSRRSSAPCSAPRSAWATSRPSTRFRRCSRSTARWAATSSRSVSRLPKPNTKRSRSAFRRCCSVA